MASPDATLFAYSSTDDDRKKEKSPSALRTISEASEALDVPQHVLRFWETKFSQIRPLKRNGGRRFYRPQDLEILQQIKHLLYNQGYTIKGAKKAIEDFARGVDGLSSDQWIANIPPANSNDNQLGEPEPHPDILAEIAEALTEEPEFTSNVKASDAARESLLALRSELQAAREELAKFVA